MKKKSYVFTSIYQIDKNPREVWDKITDVESWPRIWKYFRYVAILGEDDSLKPGSRIQCRVRAAMFYKLEFTVLVNEIVPCTKLKVSASGDLEGEGTWILNSHGGSVESVFEWNVTTDNLFLKFIEILPFGRRVLQFNHKLVMEEGYRSFLKE
jgi:hypothetical protein